MNLKVVVESKEDKKRGGWKTVGIIPGETSQHAVFSLLHCCVCSVFIDGE